MNKKSSNKSFGILFFVVFLGLGLWPLTNDNNPNINLIIISIIFLILGLLNSKLLSPLNSLWIKFGDFLSKFNSKIVLALFFYIMITPVAILRKAIKFFIKKDSNKKSFYTKISNEYLNSKFKDQF